MSRPLPARAVSQRNPVRVVASTLAALQFLVGGGALGDVIGLKAAGLASLVVAALQMGLGEYVRGQVTPWDDVAAKVDQAGQLVAGPASTVPTGLPVTDPLPADAGQVQVQTPLGAAVLLLALLAVAFLLL